MLNYNVYSVRSEINKSYYLPSHHIASFQRRLLALWNRTIRSIIICVSSVPLIGAPLQSTLAHPIDSTIICVLYQSDHQINFKIERNYYVIIMIRWWEWTVKLKVGWSNKFLICFNSSVFWLYHCYMLSNFSRQLQITDRDKTLHRQYCKCLNKSEDLCPTLVDILSLKYLNQVFSFSIEWNHIHNIIKVWPCLICARQLLYTLHIVL